MYVLKLLLSRSIGLGPEDVSLLERCPHFRGWYVQASMELGPEDVSLLDRCPHFRGWYVQASMELRPEDASLLEKCPHFKERYSLPKPNSSSHTHHCIRVTPTKNINQCVIIDSI